MYPMKRAHIALLLALLGHAPLPLAASPRWFEGTQPTRAAANLLAEMRAAESRGLVSSDYRANELAVAIARLRPDADPSALARLDAAFDAAAARFIADLHAGRVSPRAAGHDLAVPHAALDLQAALGALASTSDTGAVLDDYEPALRHYHLLKQALQRYRELALEPQLTALPPLGRRSIKPDESWEGLPGLRRLLTALGDLPPGPAPPGAEPLELDPQTVTALRRFQRRHGLEVDGAIGARTYAALTRPLADRVRQIELSPERARWLPPRLDSPPIIVNIPQFRLFAFYTTEDREDAMLQMDVIVGRTAPTHRTPVFAADMRYVVMRPYWDVPPSIVRAEFLGRLRADPGWVARNGYEIVAGPGDDARVVAPTAEAVEALARGTPRLRQKPGPDNALGLTKFMFPNRHNVYLHGTPAQSLFAQARRTFSHGCIRVADPVALAEFVLRDDPKWTRAAIVAAQQAGGPQRINLSKPIRVMVIYATALATESGDVLFFEDIYGHDERLLRQLLARAPLPPPV